MQRGNEKDIGGKIEVSSLFFPSSTRGRQDTSSELSYSSQIAAVLLSGLWEQCSVDLPSLILSISSFAGLVTLNLAIAIVFITQLNNGSVQLPPL